MDTHKQRGLLAGFFFILGLLILEAYLIWKYSLASAVFQGTLVKSIKDLTSFQVIVLLGGGLLG